MKTEYLKNKDLEKYICLFQQNKKEKFRYELMLADIATVEEKPESWQKIQEAYAVAMNEYHVNELWLTDAFYTLSKRLAYSKNFRLIDVDDAVQEGLIICFQKLDGFVVGRGKAFNYLTTCIMHHFMQQHRSAKNYNELKKKYSIHRESCDGYVDHRQKKDKNKSKYNK